ncbi:MAG: FAD-dependent oxidoreductase [Chloroflexi bacterium]|nr:FAD-dependent oxidoreductase [Chloroflexota bacterium]
MKLFQPGRIGKVEIRNRLLMAPMGTHAHNEDGSINDRMIDYYVERAKGGVGLILGQTASILKESSRSTIPAIYDDKFIAPLRRLADAVHRHGAKIGWQLEHGGKVLTGSTDPHIVALGPSAIPWVGSGKAPREATKEDIERVVEAFAEGARRLKDAGLDIIEIHGCHGDLISSFLSPLDNRRQDEYGGTVEKRARFACEVIQRVRQKVGTDFPISFRLSGADYLDGGITIEDSKQVAPLLVKAGTDALHVSAGQWESYKWGIPNYLFPDGLNVHLAEEIRKVATVPVIAVGKIGDLALAENILREGKADFVAMGRPFLTDPELPNKAREGRTDEIRRCIYCMGCMIKSMKSAHGGISCTVNPAVLREKEFILKPAASPKRIMVIGGGLAGMEAARVLAERGHKVSLYEADSKLGGQWNIASLEPQKEAFASVARDLSRSLEKAGVKVILNKPVTRQFVAENKPDAVVVATGAKPAILDVPGVNNKNVVQAVDVFVGKAKVGKTVVVVGGKYRAMEAAILLAEQGKKVSIVARSGLRQHGSGQAIIHWVYLALRDRLIEDGVYIYTQARVREIRETGVYIDFEQETAFLKADTVVLAVGAKPENALFEQLKGTVPEIYRIGDCAEPRDAMDAIREGAEIGRIV